MNPATPINLNRNIRLEKIHNQALKAMQLITQQLDELREEALEEDVDLYHPSILKPFPILQYLDMYEFCSSEVPSMMELISEIQVSKEKLKESYVEIMRIDETITDLKEEIFPMEE